MAYFFIVILLFFSSFSKSRHVFNFSFFITTLNFCLSFGYGYDWINYFDIYENIDYYKNTSAPFEPGYYYLMLAMSKIGAPFQLLHLITTLIIFSFAYLFCKKTKNPTLSFFTLFSFMGFFMFIEQVRQGIAVCIIILSTHLILDGKKIKYFLMVVLAMCFHLSAITGLAYYLLANEKKRKFGKIIYIVVSVTIIQFFLYAFENPSVISFLPVIGQKIFLYGLMNNSLDNSLFVKSSFVYIFIIILCFYFQYKEKKSGLNYGKLDGAIYSSILIWETKAAFFLQRIQYYAVSPLITGLDDFFYVRNRFSTSRIIYALTVMIVAFMPMRFEIYRKSIFDPLFILSSEIEIKNKIMQRCADLLTVDEDNFIIKQCY
ncbi:EpsG family protein [Brenneria izadpanahii]|uniref:EpsG family protein n=1 Tax=Brenneria izadpanahii TaxID=2722756 RepID=A0ABX7UV53_9GAMM|nr:EpsG family protein [Brenneria izadpanahii]QTF09270.1 EpsG family protein [Brenneria izadpanahii]